MHSLRSSVLLARLLLVWFALTLGVAGASPFIHPQSMELVCSASGEVKLIAVQDNIGGDASNKAQAHGLHTLDCSLCLATMLPPTHAAVDFARAAPPVTSLPSFATVHIAALAGAPLPPRGPPAV